MFLLLCYLSCLCRTVWIYLIFVFFFFKFFMLVNLVINKFIYLKFLFDIFKRTSGREFDECENLYELLTGCDRCIV